uniref:Uncharacterized protein n=1 Tax=Anguilla anguilla TaxID=7936 RepID=A0A0E9UVA6_ANGAN
MCHASVLAPRGLVQGFKITMEIIFTFQVFRLDFLLHLYWKWQLYFSIMRECASP